MDDHFPKTPDEIKITALYLLEVAMGSMLGESLIPPDLDDLLLGAHYCVQALRSDERPVNYHAVITRALERAKDRS